MENNQTGIEKILDPIFNFFASDKFYLPIIYIIVGIITYVIICFFINRISKVNIGKLKGKKATNTYIVAIDKRKMTIVSLIKNVVKYMIAIIIIIAILSLYGVDTTSIIASIGIVGVVLGLACQDIAKDFLSGVFLIFDNAYAVGDYVEINGFTGEVISLGLKTTKIKAYTGEVKIISNSAFTEVTNYNLKQSKLVIDIPLSYDCDIEKVEKVLNDLVPEIKAIPDVRKEVELLGIERFESSSIIYRIAIDCSPMSQYGVNRAVLRLIKLTFDKNKITIPYEQLDVHIKNK